MAKRKKHRSAKKSSQPSCDRSGKSRVKLPEAMRLCGLDETRIAQKFKGLVDRLSRRRSRNDKLLFDILKESGKVLDAYPAQRAAPGEPAAFQFVANVPRPSREALLAGAEAEPRAGSGSPAVAGASSETS